MSTCENVFGEAFKVISGKFKLVREIDAIEKQMLDLNLCELTTNIKCRENALFEAAVATIYKKQRNKLVPLSTPNEANDLRKMYCQLTVVWQQMSTVKGSISVDENKRIIRRCRDQFKKWLRYSAYKTLGANSLDEVEEMPKLIDGRFNYGLMNFTVSAEIINVSYVPLPIFDI